MIDFTKGERCFAESVSPKGENFEKNKNVYDFSNEASEHMGKHKEEN